MKAFPHERLEAYRLARQLARLVDTVGRSLPRQSAIAHELEGEVLTPVRAIARGSVEMRGDAMWSFRVARRSAVVIRRMLRLANARGRGDMAATTAAIEIAERLHAQLSMDIETLKHGRRPR
ncbi:MAG TPA: hypothetical protein VHG09_05490 [Longimicrobiales bacterium]|nr:hypothetical protein [Longimicrobiales bacterium]